MTQYKVIASLVFDNQKNGQKPLFFNVIKIRVGIRGKPVIVCGKLGEEINCVLEDTQQFMAFDVSLNEIKNFKYLEQIL